MLHEKYKLHLEEFMKSDNDESNGSNDNKENYKNGGDGNKHHYFTNKLINEKEVYNHMILSKDTDKHKFKAMLLGNFELIACIFNYLIELNINRENHKSLTSIKFKIINKLYFFIEIFNSFNEEDVDISKYNFINELYTIINNIENNKNIDYNKTYKNDFKKFATLWYKFTKDEIKLNDHLRLLLDKNSNINKFTNEFNKINSVNNLLDFTIHCISESVNIINDKDENRTYMVDKYSNLSVYTYVEEICLMEIVYIIFLHLDIFIYNVRNKEYENFYNNFKSKIFKSLNNNTAIYDLISMYSSYILN